MLISELGFSLIRRVEGMAKSKSASDDAAEREFRHSIYIQAGLFFVFAAVAHWVFGVSSKDLENLGLDLRRGDGAYVF
jgi:hypothetical protein